MRPLTLTIDGLRSYRQPGTLDFSGISLFAIVGDTGAGKSSILEAITYALYSSATWTGQPGELIADGVRTMKVALTFEADGKRWEVTRSMSRAGYPAPVHRLACQDDGLVINGRSEVNATIERLVGLDCKAFLQSVILPQGRFAELLKATPTDRGKILQNIFRVDELIAARDTADRLLARWEPRHDAFVTTRSVYLDNPSAAAGEAAERRAQAEGRKKVLDTLRTTVTKMRETADVEERSAAECDAFGGGLTDPTLKGVAATLTQLSSLAAELGTSRTALHEARELARDREKTAAEELERAARDGVGLTGLTKAEAELEALARELDSVAQDTNEAITDTAQLDNARRRAARKRAAAATAAEKADDAKTKAATANEAAKQAMSIRDSARAALAAYREKTEQHDSATEDLRQCQENLEKRRHTAEHLAGVARDAAAKSDAAEERLDELERAAAAAAASHACGPGDACPVCQRELPASWRPPSAPKLDNARRQRDQAVQSRDKARGEADKAAALVGAAADREKELQASMRRFERAIEQARDRLVETSTLTVKQLTASLTDDATILARVEAAAEKAETQRDRADAAAAEQRDLATNAMADAKAADKEVADRERSLRALMDRLTKTSAGLRARAAKLPEPVRPDVAGEAALDLTITPEERAVALGAVRASDALAVVEDRLGDLRDIEAEGSSARAERERLDEQLAALQQRWSAEIGEPAAAAARRTDRLADRIAHLEARVELTAVAEHPAGDDPAELARWATAVENAAAEAAKKLTQQAKAARDRAAKERKRAADALAKAAVADIETLDAARVEVATAAQIAINDEQRARAQIQVAAELDKRIKLGGAFLDDLRALRDLLANSRFIGFLMHRRQQALLGVATTLLGQMSSGRFGFSEDFQVVDCYSGQPRSTSTLSGGESFLASMALALAMVELAGRAGGRLDSLFLDEGFGALDAKTLDIAIDTLEGRAKAGRLVAVISHVKAVAERIEDVLAVSYSPSSGSSFRRLTPAERVGLVQDDATDAVAGLLA